MAGVCNVALRQTRAGELSMWKGCAFANAARNGVFAALLAAEGLTGPAPIFEGDLGFMKLVTREPFELAPTSAAAQPLPFMITQTYIKFWPAEYHSQSAIDAALQLRTGGSATSAKDVRSHRHPHVQRRRGHHRQGPGEVAAEDARDGRPQPALLHGRGPAWTAT